MNAKDRELIELIRRSGLVTLDWYLARNPDVAAAGVDPIEHWYFTAKAEGRNPNFLFSTRRYLEENEDVAKSVENPLAHYILCGEAELRSPSIFFDARWYRAHHQREVEVGGYTTALAHYLQHLRDPRFSPNEIFDTGYYLETYPDITATGTVPYEHFLGNGVFEGRNPSQLFDTKFYARRNRIALKDNPFAHYLSVGRKGGLPAHPAADRNVFTETQKWTMPGPLFKTPKRDVRRAHRTPQVDAFAYYLPQFHPIEINDEAWGAGFTEWRNVARGVPRFEGHYQPRLPRDLGFYDLRSPDALMDQIEMAVAAGLKGFGFYYYNFDGDRVLDLPIELFMELDHELGFFLLWANENWTRTWDGLDRQVIKGQSFGWQALPAIAVDIARHMQDARYYRVGGRPLFVVYRPGVIPEAKRYLARLGELIAEKIGVAPLIFMAQGFGEENPSVFGLDGAIEFPPHKIGEGLEPINRKCKLYDHAYRGQVFSYDDFVQRACTLPAPPYPLIRTVFPSWDNEARRPGYGMVVHGSTPQKYRAWLAHAVKFAKRNPIAGQSIVAINAWNEWCEGAYLEPDLHYGAAYLEETTRVIFQPAALPRGESILLVGHDGHRHGAQLLLLDIARQLKMFGHRVAMLLLEGGALESEYRAACDYFAVVGTAQPIQLALRDPALQDYRLAITNTVVSGAAAPHLRERGFRIISLVHEMGALIAERGLQSRCEAIADHSDLTVFPAECVRHSFSNIRPVEEGRTRIMPQGIYNVPIQADPPKKRTGPPVIINVGYGDLRKGYDLFVATANDFAERKLPGKFVWVGDVEKGLETWITGTGANFQQIPFTNEVHAVLATADLFFLTSREDPLPSAALEALATGIPVVCFQGTGGIPDVVTQDPNLGTTVPAFSIPEAAAAIIAQARADTAVRKKARAKLALGQFSFPRYVSRLVEELGSHDQSVGVVIPNYNYSQYLRARVESVVNQSARPCQVFLLDDCSTDGSRATIGEIARAYKPFIATSFNAKNSGSPFAQWEAGAALCSTKYVWIAEADDLAAATFLEKTTAFMEEHDCDLCFTDSSQIDSAGVLLARSYDYYFRSVDQSAFETSFVMNGRDFLRRLLSHKNLILNVSAVLWRREALVEALSSLRNELRGFRVAGDWRLYTEVCARGGRIGFIAQPLNQHRRHAESATHAQARTDQLNEIAVVHKVIQDKVGVNVETISGQQAAYLKELTQQFNLNEVADREPLRSA